MNYIRTIDPEECAATLMKKAIAEAEAKTADKADYAKILEAALYAVCYLSVKACSDSFVNKEARKTILGDSESNYIYIPPAELRARYF